LEAATYNPTTEHTLLTYKTSCSSPTGAQTQTSNPPALTGFLSNTNPFSKPQNPTNQWSTQQSQPPTNNPISNTLNSTSNDATKIDLEHLRPTTKYDQLTPTLQAEIETADAEITAQIKQAEELEVLLPIVQEQGAGLKPQVEFVAGKLDEVQAGFELDAVEIVEVREGIVRRDEGEAKMCWREVERLKAPDQYQYRGQQSVGSSGPAGGVYGGLGLSGWWNHPQTIRGSMRGGGSSGVGVQVPDENDDSSPDPRVEPPANLLDLFNRRADDMKVNLETNKLSVAQIEAHIDVLEEKIRIRERELLERMEYGAVGAGGAGQESERAQQIKMLKYVFGEAERSLYEVAGKIGEVRDRVIEIASGGW